MARFNRNPAGANQLWKSLRACCMAFWPTRSRLIVATAGLSLAMPSFADLVPMELVAAPGLTSDCNPCRISTTLHDDLDEFSFRYTTVPAQTPNVIVTFEEEEFGLDAEPALMENRELFPLYRVDWSNRLPLGIYAIPARTGVRDRYYHYFRLDAGYFSYLGLLPSLFYDAELDAFAAVRLDEPGGSEEYYGLVSYGWNWTLSAVTGPVERAAWEAAAPYAGTWETLIDDNNIFLINTKKATPRFGIETLGSWGTVEVVGERSYEGYDLIIYYAGAAGTSSLTEAKYSAIYSRARNKILGAFPLAYRNETNNTKWTQPVWILGADKIAIRDVNSNLDIVIDIN